MRAYLENLFGYTEDAMRSQLSVEGFAYNKAQDSDVKGTWVPAAANVPAHVMFKNVDQIFR